MSVIVCTLELRFKTSHAIGIDIQHLILITVIHVDSKACVINCFVKFQIIFLMDGILPCLLLCFGNIIYLYLSFLLDCIYIILFVFECVPNQFFLNISVTCKTFAWRANFCMCKRNFNEEIFSSKKNPKEKLSSFVCKI